LNIRCYNNSILANFLNRDHRVRRQPEELIQDVASGLPDNFASWSLLQQNQFLEMKTLLSGYLLSSQGDRMSMAHSVEGRYPFLDHRLVDLVFSMPDKYKLNIFSQKHLLRKAFSRDIPASIVDRPKRPYMAPDLKSFFRNGRLIDPVAHFLSDGLIDAYGIFDKKMIGRFLRKFSSGVPDQIGYRDNMVITFLLSAQMACYWAGRPRVVPLKESHKRVAVIER
jgi:asparagine synthase (glutamine-hydrolysing)